MSADLVTLGETMALVRATEVGSLEHVTGMRLSVGGAESNVAIAARRLGASVAWIGRVGDDGAGRRITRELRAEGVDVHAHVDDGAGTGMMLKSHPSATTTEVTYGRHMSAGSRLAPDDLPADVFATARIVHVTGITPALSASAESAMWDALDRADAAHAIVSFDVNHRSRLWRDRDPSTLYRAVTARAGIVFAGLDEARLVVGDGTPAQVARRLGELGPAAAIVKLGAEGAVAVIDGAELWVPAVPVAVVDTVGAGDGFVGAYLAAALAGAPVAERLALAARVGAAACTGPGDWESYPHARDLAHEGPLDPVQR
jgi:2-dehydro-3-deoxygluconokinase